MEFPQSTLGQILDSEREMVLTASQRYGEYFNHALACSQFLAQFLKSIDRDRSIAASFFGQVKIHHILALFSTVRLHKVQALMNLRQVLEAGACAAFAIANPDHKHFVDTDEFGILDPSQKLAKRRYTWLRENYRAGSDAIETLKKQLNSEGTHANLLTAQTNFRPDYNEGWFGAPFFDIEDEHFIKINLWRIGKVAITLLDVFYGVNNGRNVLKFVDNYVPVFQHLAAKEDVLRQEMISGDRYRRAMELQNARERRH